LGARPPTPPTRKELEPAFEIDGVSFVIDLISHWSRRTGASRTWMVIQLPERTFPLKWEAVAGGLFRKLNTEVVNGEEQSLYVTTDRGSWSFCYPDADQNIDQNAAVLRQWIEQYLDLGGIRSEAFSVWTADHARELRGPRPKGN
jgi:hypothetical protein